MHFTSTSVSLNFFKPAAIFSSIWAGRGSTGGVDTDSNVYFDKHFWIWERFWHIHSILFNIPSLPAYDVFISQLIRYARACSSYECFILRAARLLFKLLRQGFVMKRLKSSLRKFMVDMGISSNIMKSPSSKCYMTFWDMTIYNDTLNWSDITPICELITELDFNTDFDLITEFWRFP